MTLRCVVGAGYAGYLAVVPVHRFGAAATGTPLDVIEEGTLRGVLIGDSMVFGSGVDDGDTIDAARARRLSGTGAGTPVEILNLGVQGSNLPAFLLGTSNNPYTLHAMRASDARSDVSKVEFLERHVQAIEAIRRSRGSTPLFVFLYRLDDPRWGETVRRTLGEGASVVEHGPLPDADCIPDDGHPTPEGNRHFAALIGDAIDRAGIVP